MARDERRIREPTDANCQVEARIDEIDHLIVETYTDAQAGVLEAKARDLWNQIICAEVDGAGYGELAERLFLVGRNLAHGLAGLGQDALAAAVEACACFGKGKASRGPVEEAHAELFLQPPNVVRHRGLRDVQFARRFAEGACVDDAFEHGHMTKRFHDCIDGCSLRRTIISFQPVLFPFHWAGRIAPWLTRKGPQ